MNLMVFKLLLFFVALHIFKNEFQLSEMSKRSHDFYRKFMTANAGLPISYQNETLLAG